MSWNLSVHCNMGTSCFCQASDVLSNLGPVWSKRLIPALPVAACGFGMICSRIVPLSTRKYTQNKQTNKHRTTRSADHDGATIFCCLFLCALFVRGEKTIVERILPVNIFKQIRLRRRMLHPYKFHQKRAIMCSNSIAIPVCVAFAGAHILAEAAQQRRS